MAALAPSAARAARPAPDPAGGAPARVYAALGAMVAAYAAVFAALSVARHESFATGRFDVGNMVQALWSTTQGRPLETTAVGGEQFSRLGAHVDPLLAAFAPLWALWPSPNMLLVAQAAIVALGALPAFWLGRRWLGDDRLALAAAGVYLLYPPLQWATVTEFHPLTLAAPLLLGCIWAAAAGRCLTFALLAVPAALTKEQVGLAVAGIGLWMAIRAWRGRGERPGRARRELATGLGVGAAALAWVAVAVLVIIPHHALAGASPFLGRYDALGEGPRELVVTTLTRPWEPLALMAEPGRLAYLAALLVPLALLSLAAPLLLVGALPELYLNLVSDLSNQQSIAFHYVAVIVPFLVAGAILGLARVRRRARGRLGHALARPGRLAAGMVGALAVAGLFLGPLPRPDAVAFGWEHRLDQYAGGARADALGQAVALIPDGVPVSAGNHPGAHLSDREHIYSFPVIADARWVIVDEARPVVGQLTDPTAHAIHLAALRARADFTEVYAREGVRVFRRAGA